MAGFWPTSAPTTFKWLIKSVQKGLHWQSLLVPYLNVFYKDFNSHMEWLVKVCQHF